MGQRAVAGDAHGEHRGLLRERRVELIVGETRPRSVQRRVEKVDARRPGKRLSLDAGDGLGDDWAFQQAVGAYWYYRSSNQTMADMGRTTLDRLISTYA